MDLTFLKTNDPAWLEKIGRLRAEVWRAEDSIEFSEFGDSDCWLDELDPEAYHWAVLHEGELVAAARLSLHDGLSRVPYRQAFVDFGIRPSSGEKIASINRLVVRKDFRGQGLARRLDAVRLETAKKLGAGRVVALPVGEKRAQALNRLGYKTFGERLDPRQFGIELSNAEVYVTAADLSEIATTIPESMAAWDFEVPAPRVSSLG